MGLRSLIWNTFRGFAHSVQMNRNFRCGTILLRTTRSLNDALKQKLKFKLLSFAPLSVRKYCTLPGNTSSSGEHVTRSQINKEGSRTWCSAYPVILVSFKS